LHLLRIRLTNCLACSYRYSSGAGGFDVVSVDLAGALNPSGVESSPAGGHFSAGGGHALFSGGAALAGPSAASAEASDWAPGSAVILSSSHAKHADAARGPLRTGDIGRIVTSEAQGQVLVRTEAGRQVILPCWAYAAKNIFLHICSGGTTRPRSLKISLRLLHPVGSIDRSPRPSTVVFHSLLVLQLKSTFVFLAGQSISLLIL
jgi:hypothetical protein